LDWDRHISCKAAELLLSGCNTGQVGNKIEQAHYRFWTFDKSNLLVPKLPRSSLPPEPANCTHSGVSQNWVFITSAPILRPAVGDLPPKSASQIAEAYGSIAAKNGRALVD